MFIFGNEFQQKLCFYRKFHFLHEFNSIDGVSRWQRRRRSRLLLHTLGLNTESEVNKRASTIQSDVRANVRKRALSACDRNVLEPNGALLCMGAYVCVRVCTLYAPVAAASSAVSAASA